MTISPSSGYTGTFAFTIRWGKQRANLSPKQLCVSSLQWNIFRRRMVVYQVILNPIRNFVRKTMKTKKKKPDNCIRRELSYPMPPAQSWSWKIFTCIVRQKASECNKQTSKKPKQTEFIYQSWNFSRRSTQQISHLLLNDLSSLPSYCIHIN